MRLLRPSIRNMLLELGRNQPDLKPDENTTAHVVGLCDSVCEKYFLRMPMCHKCHMDDREYFCIKPGEGLVNSNALVQSSHIVSLCLNLEAHLLKTTGAARKELVENLEKRKPPLHPLRRRTCSSLIYIV